MRIASSAPVSEQARTLRQQSAVARTHGPDPWLPRRCRHHRRQRRDDRKRRRPGAQGRLLLLGKGAPGRAAWLARSLSFSTWKHSLDLAWRDPLEALCLQIVPLDGRSSSRACRTRSMKHRSGVTTGTPQDARISGRNECVVGRLRESSKGPQDHHTFAESPRLSRPPPLGFPVGHAELRRPGARCRSDAAVLLRGTITTDCTVRTGVVFRFHLADRRRQPMSSVPWPGRSAYCQPDDKEPRR